MSANARDPQNTDAEYLRDRPKETKRYAWHYVTEQGNSGTYIGHEQDEAAVSAYFYARFGTLLSELERLSVECPRAHRQFFQNHIGDGAPGEPWFNSAPRGNFMKMSDCFTSKYLKAADLSGRQIKVQIESATKEKMADGGEEKPVIYFVGKDKGLVVNRTNATLLIEVLGDDCEAWKGHTIELSTQRVPFQGKMVDGIRVRVPIAAPGTEFVEDDIPF